MKHVTCWRCMAYERLDTRNGHVVTIEAVACTCPPEPEIEPFFPPEGERFCQTEGCEEPMAGRDKRALYCARCALVRQREKVRAYKRRRAAA